MKGNSIQSWILDSTPRITNSRFRIPWSLSVKLGFWILIFSGFRIPQLGFPYMARKLAALLTRTSLPFVNLNGPEKLKG